MDPNVIVPLAGMLTGVVTVVAIGWGLVRTFQGPVGQALARRIQGKGGLPDSEVLAELEDLRGQLEQVQQRLADTEERLDFSERLLAQRSEGAPVAPLPPERR